VQLVAEVEAWVNNHCMDSLAVATSVKSLQEARAGGATALFGEKYGEEVRVVKIGDVSQVRGCLLNCPFSPFSPRHLSHFSRSQELCGGTHVSSLSEVLPFKILSTESVASGTKRIEAVAGRKAIEVLLVHSNTLGRIGTLLKVNLHARRWSGRAKGQRERARKGEECTELVEVPYLMQYLSQAPKSGVEEAAEKLLARYNDLKKEHTTLKKQVGATDAAKAASPSKLTYPRTTHLYAGETVVVHTLPEDPASAPAMLRAVGGAACAADKAVHIFLQPASGLVLVVADPRSHGKLRGAAGVLQIIQEGTGGDMDGNSSMKFATGVLARPQDIITVLVGLADPPRS
jgi:alanyl-tRNA synthetase